MCFTEICSFNYIDTTTYSKVIQASLSERTISIKLDKVIDANKLKLLIKEDFKNECVGKTDLMTTGYANALDYVLIMIDNLIAEEKE